MSAPDVPPGRKGTFTLVSETRYVMNVESLGVTFDLDRVRREKHDLAGELLVRCKIPGAKTTEGDILSASDFNVSGQRSRAERAKFLAERAVTRDQVDWIGLLEEFCLRVIEFDRRGQPTVNLADLPFNPEEDRRWYFDDRFPVLQDLPMIWFGAGGTCKSYLALYAAMRLSFQGIRVLYCDWELGARDHRQRLGMMQQGAAPPSIQYLRCERPMLDESERIRRVIKEQSIDYVICDSIAFATGGRPEEAEQANAYFRAVKSWNIGSLHLAHMVKSDFQEQQAGMERKSPPPLPKTPFGSVFWGNAARSIWYLQRTEEEISPSSANLDDETSEFTVGFYSRKSFDRRHGLTRAYLLRFTPRRVAIESCDIGDSPELVERLSLADRMKHFLKRHGPSLTSELAEELGAKDDSIRKALRRGENTFRRDSDGRIKLVYTA